MEALHHSRREIWHRERDSGLHPSADRSVMEQCPKARLLCLETALKIQADKSRSEWVSLAGTVISD